jgi:hypothetical protein
VHCTAPSKRRAGLRTRAEQWSWRRSDYLPRLRLCRFLARSFLYLCFRIFLRRFLITLPMVSLPISQPMSQRFAARRFRHAQRGTARAPAHIAGRSSLPASRSMRTRFARRGSDSPIGAHRPADASAAADPADARAPSARADAKIACRPRSCANLDGEREKSRQAARDAGARSKRSAQRGAASAGGPHPAGRTGISASRPPGRAPRSSCGSGRARGSARGCAARSAAAASGACPASRAR